MVLFGFCIGAKHRSSCEISFANQPPRCTSEARVSCACTFVGVKPHGVESGDAALPVYRPVHVCDAIGVSPLLSPRLPGPHFSTILGPLPRVFLTSTLTLPLERTTRLAAPSWTSWLSLRWRWKEFSARGSPGEGLGAARLLSRRRYRGKP